MQAKNGQYPFIIKKEINFFMVGLICNYLEEKDSQKKVLKDRIIKE